MYGDTQGYWNQPGWSPDGKHLLIQGISTDNQQGFFLVDVETGKYDPIYVKKSDPIKKAVPLGTFPRFSANGTDIFFIMDHKKSIAKMNIKSKVQKVIYEGKDQILYYRPSNDGTKIAFGYFFENRNALFMLTINDGKIKKIAEFEENVTPYIVNWSQDDSYLIFQKVGKKIDHSVWRMKVTGGEAEKVFSLSNVFPQGQIKEIELNSDGQSIAINLGTGEMNKVWSMENLLKD